jgi:exopolysaccharide biosynthesis polyprenyl glycosylphosphotransferase
VANLIQLCYDFKVQFKFIPDIYSLMSLNFKPALLGTLPVMELNSLAIDGWGRIIKRVMDILFSLFLVILLSPVLLAIAILIKLTSRGPILYAHERVGRDEKPFKFYKFRSMYIDKSDFQGGVYWTTKNDDKTRITPVGRILRKTNLDELPQLWNILIGDMSFVGPRPEFPKHVERFEKEIPDYFRRHRVKTGLSGWAAVNGLKGDTSIEERVRYDIYYIENWSLWFDLKIIIKTFWLIVYEAFAGKIEYSSRSRVDN